MSAWPALIQAACDCVFAFNNLLTPRMLSCNIRTENFKKHVFYFQII